MGLEFWIGLIGAAASIAGLSWNREGAKKLTFALLVLLCGTISVRELIYHRRMEDLQHRIVNSLSQSIKSADQLYEDVSPIDIPRLEFDDALNQAVEAGRLRVERKGFWTPDNVEIRVRVYSAK